jgi:hypothetical protein
VATVKPLREQAAQEQVALDRLQEWLNHWLSNEAPADSGAC